MYHSYDPYELCLGVETWYCPDPFVTLSRVVEEKKVEKKKSKGSYQSSRDAYAAYIPAGWL